MTITRSTRRWNWTLSSQDLGGIPIDRTFQMVRFLHDPGAADSIVFPGGGTDIVARKYRPPAGEPGLGDPPGTIPSIAWPRFSPVFELGTQGWGIFLFITQAVSATATVFGQIKRHRGTPGLPFVENVTPGPPLGSMTASLNETGPILIGVPTGTLQNQSGGKDVLASDVPILHLTFTRSGSKAGATCIYKQDDAFDSLLLSPFHMPEPKIIWDGNLLQFPHGLTGYSYQRRSVRSSTFSQGGVLASSLRHKYDDVTIQVRNFDDAVFEAALRAWWAWASRGNPYSFTLDGAEDADNEVTVQAEKGSVALTLDAITGITVGKRYIVRTEDGRDEQKVLVSGLPGGNVVDFATTPLLFRFQVASIFRSLDHFPKLVSQDVDDPVSENLVTFNLVHRMREDRG